MRTTIDIPDRLYRRLKLVAALRSCSVEDLVLLGVEAQVKSPGTKRKNKRVTLPIIESTEPGRLRLTNRRINEILFPQSRG